jgi:tetratricopeptide (TPR) repeat protein
MCPAELYLMVAEYYADSVHDYNKAKKLYHCALTLALQCNSAWVQVEVLYGLAVIGYLHGAWSEALRLGCEVHKIAVAAGNVKGELAGLQCQARCYMGLGAFKHGMQMVNKAKELVLQAGMQGGSSDFDLMNLEGEVCYLKTEYAESRHIREIMLSHSSPILSPVNYAYTLVSLVALDLATGASTDIVLHNLHIAVDTFKRIHYPRGISLCDAYAADLSLHAGDTARARGQYIHTFTGAYDIDNELACYCLARLADSTNPVHAASEVAQWAIVFFAFAMHQSQKNMLAVHQALQSLGDVFAQQGMDAEALGILAAALEGFTWMDVHQSKAECMRTMGDVHFRCGQSSTACIFWTEARPLFERSLQAKAVSEIDSRLVKVKEEEEHHNTNVGYLSKLDVPTASLQQLPISEEEDIDVNIEMTGAQGVGMGV